MEISIYGTIKRLLNFLNKPTEEGFALRPGNDYSRDSKVIYLPLFEIGYRYNKGECLELHACKICSTRGVHATPLKDFFFCRSCDKLIHVSMLKSVKYSEGKYVDA